MRVAGRSNGLTAGVWLASLALLLRAALPGGFMLNPADHGWGVSIALCAGTATMATDSAHLEETRGKSDAPHKADTVPCAFTGLLMPHLAQSSAPGSWFPASVAGTPLAGPIATHQAAPARMPAPPPPSQAPPTQPA